jgi:hypothetical protein
LNKLLYWINKEHPNILIDSMPGSCTGVAQPWMLVYSGSSSILLISAFLRILWRQYLQVDNGEGVTFDDRLPMLQNTNIWWLWKATRKSLFKGQ